MLHGQVQGGSWQAQGVRWVRTSHHFDTYDRGPGRVLAQALEQCKPAIWKVYHIPRQAHTGAEVSYDRFQNILREAVVLVIPASQAQWVVTYSLRRVGATLTQMFHLDAKKEHAFGGWSVTSVSREACDVRRSMPLLYNGRRGAMEETATLAVWRAAITLIRETRMFTSHPTWEGLGMLASAHWAQRTRCEQLLRPAIGTHCVSAS